MTAPDANSPALAPARRWGLPAPTWFALTIVGVLGAVAAGQFMGDGGGSGGPPPVTDVEHRDEDKPHIQPPTPDTELKYAPIPKH